MWHFAPAAGHGGCREFEPSFLSRRVAAGCRDPGAETGGPKLSVKKFLRIGGASLPACSWAAAALIGFGPACIAAPSISGISGSIADGQTVTISGSGFGNGPTVLVFDDFEGGDGQDGKSVPLTSPEIGKWSAYTTGARPTYSSHARSGQHGFRITDPQFDPNKSGSAMGSFTEIMSAPTTEFFITYSVLVPQGTTFPGASSPGTLPPMSTWKAFWMYDGPEGFHGNGQADIWLPAWSGYWQIGGNSGAVLKNLGPLGGWFSFKGWNRFAVWAKANPASPVKSNGTIFVQATSSEKGHSEGTWSDRSPFQGSTAFNNPPSTGKWDRFTVPGWYGNGDNSHNQMTYDDIYVATGANAAARVEIGDASSYKKSKILAISTPQSWSDGQIVFTVRAGPFRDFSGAYLYVVDGENNVSKGYALGQAMPNPPGGVAVK